MYQVVFCTCVYMGLDGSTCSEPLPERACSFEPLEHVPRTSVRAQHARTTDVGQGSILRKGSRRAPCVPRSRQHEDRPAAGKENNGEGPKKRIYVHVQGSPPECVLK